MGVSVHLLAFPEYGTERDDELALFILVASRFTLGKQLPTPGDVSAELGLHIL